MRTPLLVALLWLTACGSTDALLERHEDEPLDDPTKVVEQGIVSCNERSDTGYRNGNPFPITVVQVDGYAAELRSANAYVVMQQAAAANGVNLRVVSGFRTMAEQQYVYHCYTTCSCNSCSLAAYPGYSLHQSGEAFDLNTSEGGVYNWLANNAAYFGFRRTVPSEPWHWEWNGGGPGGGPCGRPVPPPLPDDVFTLATLESLGSTDLNGDGKADLCARNSDGITCYLANGTGFPTVVPGPALSNANGWNDPDNYHTLRMADYNGDGRADLCARANDGMICWPSTGTGFGPAIQTGALSNYNGWAVPQYYSTIRMADINGDGKADLCARGGAAFYCWLSLGDTFSTTLITGPALSDANGWGDPTNYATLRMGDVNGDGKADVCARANDEFLCWLSDGAGFPTQVNGPALSDANGWANQVYWSTLRLTDIDGDKRADLCVRSNSSILCYRSLGTSFSAAIAGPALSDPNGWSEHNNYSTIRFADIDGDGDRDLCARANDGVLCWPWTGNGFGAEIATGLLIDAYGWNLSHYYSTIRFADVTGDGKADLCALAADGIACWPSTGTGFAARINGPAWTTANGWSLPQYYATLRIGP